MRIEPLASGEGGTAENLIGQYRAQGYAIIRNLFSPDEIARIAEATDQIRAEGIAHGRSFRHGNLFYNVTGGADGTPAVRMVQWPSYHQPVLNAVRLDPRFARILKPFIGGDMKQIINQIHWKPRDVPSDFAWHQDSRFRRPASAYRDLGRSYVQTGLAIDPHTADAGAMRFIPKSHAGGDLHMDTAAPILAAAMADEALKAVGLNPADAVDVLLNPGDLALWNPYLVHGSGPNHTPHERRLYINGYVRASACDRGEWAFRGGEPVPFGPEPALVHYEELRERPGPHYL